MQTVYYTTSNFIRHTGNVVDLSEYRRKLAQAEGSLAPAPIQEGPSVRPFPHLTEVERPRQERAPRADRRSDRPAPRPRQDGAPVHMAAEDLPLAAADDEKAQRITQFLTGLMEHLHVQAEPQVHVNEEGAYRVILAGHDLGAIIGRRGETLDAIQQLTNYAVNTGSDKRIRIQMDAENYRAKREQSLESLANKVAAKVAKYRRSVTLEPMNAYERHVIHAALQDVKGVTTYSIGTEPNRRVVVAYDREGK